MQFPPVEKNSRKKLNFENFSQETEVIWSFILFLLSNIFKISTFWMKIEILRWVLENLRKVQRKISKTQGEKTQNLWKKTQEKISTSGMQFPPVEKNSRKKLNFENFSQETEVIWSLSYFCYQIFSKSVHFEWKLKFCVEF